MEAFTWPDRPRLGIKLGEGPTFNPGGLLELAWLGRGGLLDEIEGAVFKFGGCCCAEGGFCVEGVVDVWLCKFCVDVAGGAVLVLAAAAAAPDDDAKLLEDP